MDKIFLSFEDCFGDSKASKGSNENYISTRQKFSGLRLIDESGFRYGLELLTFLWAL